MLRIGITADWREQRDVEALVLERAYAEWVRSAGMVPVVLPSMPGSERDLVAGLHGLVLSGGRDIQPRLYCADPEPRPGEVFSHKDRTAFEFALVWRSIRNKLPLLGICLGCQTLNTALGGDLVRHLPDPKCRHRRRAEGAPLPRHRLHAARGTIIGSLYDSPDVRVSSSHHQSVGRPAEGFVVSAWGPDRVVEAIENPSRPHLLGIQWHPERMSRSRFSKDVLSWLKAQAEAYAAGSR